MFVHQIVIASNAPGKISVQGADSIDCVPSAMSTPQLVSGSWIPKPKKLMKLSARITPGIVNVAYTRAGPNTFGTMCRRINGSVLLTVILSSHPHQKQKNA